MTITVITPDAWLAAAEPLRGAWFSYLDASDGIGGADGDVIDVELRVVARGEPIILRTRVPREAGELPTLAGIWPAAGWSERLIAEGFGVRFDGGDDRPLLQRPGNGAPRWPLRKDRLLAARTAPWPGAATDPAEGQRARRRLAPVGVPDPAASTIADQVASAYGSGRSRR